MYHASDSLQLVPVDVVKDLGVKVPQEGTWSMHIQQLTVKAISVASWVLSVFYLREKNVMLTLYKSLGRSQLEYCCPLWHPHKVGDIQKLKNVQRNFTRKIYGLSRLHYWDRLKALDLMSLQRRMERYIVLHVWKVLNDKILNDLKIVFRPPSRTGIRAVIPPLNRMYRQFNV